MLPVLAEKCHNRELRKAASGAPAANCRTVSLWVPRPLGSTAVCPGAGWDAQGATLCWTSGTPCPPFLPQPRRRKNAGRQTLRLRAAVICGDCCSNCDAWWLVNAWCAIKRRAGRRCHPLKEVFVVSVRAVNFNEDCCRVSSRRWCPLCAEIHCPDRKTLKLPYHRRGGGGWRNKASMKLNYCAPESQQSGHTHTQIKSQQSLTCFCFFHCRMILDVWLSWFIHVSIDQTNILNYTSV